MPNRYDAPISQISLNEGIVCLTNSARVETIANPSNNAANDQLWDSVGSTLKSSSYGENHTSGHDTLASAQLFSN